ncbi:MAG: toll/interleukin-1 receptor domain-containing protein [Leptolyngbyaceae cyanobacterium]
MNPTAAAPLDVFISYARKDEDLKEELEVHLSTLIRQNKIKPWQDRTIEAGTEWDPQIKAALEAAHIILLLITPRFIASDYINDVELAQAIERHRAGTARVVPIILKPVDLVGTPISQLQALPKDAKPVTRWEDQDEAFLDVVKGLRRVVDSLSTQMNAPKSTAASSHSSATTPSSLNIDAHDPAATAATPKTKAQKRLELFQLLSNLPGPTFDSIVYALNVPPPVMPPPVAPQGQRVPALLNWAQSPVGCGLDDVEAMVATILQ